MMNRGQAEALLAWAEEKNPGPWGDHVRTAARAAETIARAAAGPALDPERAYLSGLLHDIGRYEGVTGLRHTYAGYALLMQKGEPELARICLTHSFPIPYVEAFAGGMEDCTPEETEVIRAALAEPMDDYDRLIQLCDSLSLPQGVCLLEKRLMDVVMRHGLNPYSLEKWKGFIQIKEEFDRRCDGSIYALFGGEVERVSVR